jgi:hypothetical protein
MFACYCGQRFGSDNAREQHRRDKAKANSAGQCLNNSNSLTAPSPQIITQLQTTQSLFKTQFKQSRDEWMSRDIGKLEETINVRSLSPADAPVSSGEDPLLLCSYNWLDQNTPAIYVPGNSILRVEVDSNLLRWSPDMERYLASSNPSRRLREIFYRPKCFTTTQIPLRGLISSYASYEPRISFRQRRCYRQPE